MSRPRRPHLRPLAAINVTPLVDVMLVLLIIFMVTAALDRGGIPVNLPSASAPPLTPEAKTTTVTVDRDGRLFLNHTLVAKDRLATELQGLGSRDSTLVFRADQEVPYGTFVEVVGLIRAAGIERLTIETATPAPSPP